MTKRALVLGGGGPVGVAWETGLLAGFARAGIDLSKADRVLGTSAGAIVGARLRSSRDPAALADPLLAPRPPGAPPPPAPSSSQVLERLTQANRADRNPAEIRREFGALAMAAQTMPEAAYLAMIGRALHAPAPPPWPEDGFSCTSVDAEDGGFQLWESAAGADLVAAVAASCAVPGVFPPVTLNGRRYIDGGMRSFTNADLAAGHEVVVVVAMRLARMPDFALRQLDQEVEGLKSDGSTVVVIGPDEASVEAIGDNLMDFGRNAPVAQAGLAQAAAQAAVLKEIWGG
jgi:NTE family protein